MRNRGFTLVEVLVALLVMAVMAAMAWQGMDGLVRTQTATQASMERTLRLNTVIAQWEQDLLAVQETTAISSLSFDGSTTRITRRVDGGLQLVAWSLQGSQWLRWVGPVSTDQVRLQDSWIRSQQLDGSEAAAVRALAGVESAQVYFYRGNAWTNAQSTGDLAAAAAAASAPVRTQLPDGVRLVLQIDGQTLTRDIALTPKPP